LAAGVFLFAVGCILTAAGIIEFRSLRKISAMEVSNPITTGIYRWSRNPQFLGLYLPHSLHLRALTGRFCCTLESSIFQRCSRTSAKSFSMSPISTISYAPQLMQTCPFQYATSKLEDTYALTLRAPREFFAFCVVGEESCKPFVASFLVC